MGSKDELRLVPVHRVHSDCPGVSSGLPVRSRMGRPKKDTPFGRSA